MATITLLLYPTCSVTQEARCRHSTSTLLEGVWYADDTRPQSWSVDPKTSTPSRPYLRITRDGWEAGVCIAVDTFILQNLSTRNLGTCFPPHDRITSPKRCLQQQARRERLILPNAFACLLQTTLIPEKRRETKDDVIVIEDLQRAPVAGLWPSSHKDGRLRGPLEHRT
jgi:hypothetical protein